MGNLYVRTIIRRLVGNLNPFRLSPRYAFFPVTGAVRIRIAMNQPRKVYLDGTRRTAQFESDIPLRPEGLSHRRSLPAPDRGRARISRIEDLTIFVPS